MTDTFVQIENCASSGRLANVLEGSFFTLNNLVLAVKGSTECTLDLFLTDFEFLRSFRIG